MGRGLYRSRGANDNNYACVVNGGGDINTGGNNVNNGLGVRPD